MTWDDILERLESAGLHLIEDTYMENFGKVLTAQRPEFRDRSFRCTHGIAHCNGIRIEVFVFPDSAQCAEFLDIAGTDPWWFTHSNAVLHFSNCDPEIVDKVMNSL